MHPVSYRHPAAVLRTAPQLRLPAQQENLEQYLRTDDLRVWLPAAGIAHLEHRHQQSPALDTLLRGFRHQPALPLCTVRFSVRPAIFVQAVRLRAFSRSGLWSIRRLAGMGCAFCPSQLASGILALPQTDLYQALAVGIFVHGNKHFVAVHPANL